MTHGVPLLLVQMPTKDLNINLIRDSKSQNSNEEPTIMTYNGNLKLLVTPDEFTQLRKTSHMV